MNAIAQTVFAVPPFPGARPSPVLLPSSSDMQVPSVTSADLIAALRHHRVGGPFWNEGDIWSPAASDSPLQARGDDPRLLLGALAGRPLQALSGGPFADLALHEPHSDNAEQALERLVSTYLLNGIGYADPFTGMPLSPLALIETLAGWRDLIAINRPIMAAYGFAHWKRDTVDPLLWGGRPVPFRSAQIQDLETLPHNATVAVWKARMPSTFLTELERGPWHLLEVEDGFIRSAGLGADCVPPLSIVVDDLGVHYDYARPSRLEQMLAENKTSETDLARAAKLRAWIVHSGVSKYGVAAGPQLERKGGSRRHILVVGQVEDDRSILFGSSDVRHNLNLLRRVRALEPEAWIVYRPHPDVEAGHRQGAIPLRKALEIANEVEPRQPISALIAMADEIHVMTSLAGFEALMQGKPVTTHGMPFFAGWGLTRDLATAPPRRDRTLSIDQLIATVLLRYPRYLDPVTNLPCTAETLIMRLLSGVQRQNAALVPLRRLTGWIKRTAAELSGIR